jgi:hypothetical protein
MASAHPLRLRETLVSSLDDEGLEQLTLELVRPVYPQAHTTGRGIDGGVDIFSDHERPPERGWQCKNVKTIEWTKYRQSLESAMAEPDPPLNYTYVFSRAMTKGERHAWSAKFLPWAREKYGDKLPDLRYWDDLAQRLESRPDLVESLLESGLGGRFVRSMLADEASRKPPLLSLVVVDSDGGETSTLQAAARPLPVDIDRVVANELADARQSAAIRHRALETFAALSDPFSVRPSEAEHERAREEFLSGLTLHGETLRQWLEDYATAARERANSFELRLRLKNDPGGGHASGVAIEIDLPDAVELVSDVEDVTERPTMPIPPETPRYQPPQPRSTLARLDRPVAWNPPAIAGIEFPSVKLDPYIAWTVDDNILSTSVGGLHAGRAAPVGNPLLLCAAGPGEHKIHWRAYSTSTYEATTGTISLIVPPDREGPVVGRLRGITSYPDVPLINKDDEIEVEIRSADLPEQPVLAEDDLDQEEEEHPLLGTRLRHQHALMTWRQLGLDPAYDGPVDLTEAGDIRPMRPGDDAASALNSTD